MNNRGWYPDPGGTPGQYRYWDGEQWGNDLTPSPPSVGPLDEGAPAPQQRPIDKRASDTVTRDLVKHLEHPEKKTFLGRVSGTVTIVAVVLACLVLLVIGVAELSGMPKRPTSTAWAPMPDVCLKHDRSSTELRDLRDVPGRVLGGELSYKKFDGAWTEPKRTIAVSFATNAQSQVRVTEAEVGSYSPAWGASVLVGELIPNKRFTYAKEVSQFVIDCSRAEIYPGSTPVREEISSKATTVSGKEGWILEMHLTYDIAKVKEKGETAIVVAVRTSDEVWSFFWARVPDSRPDLLTEVRERVAGLKIEPY